MRRKRQSLKLYSDGPSKSDKEDLHSGAALESTARRWIKASLKIRKGIRKREGKETE
jgi:hypothetical protein